MELSCRVCRFVGLLGTLVPPRDWGLFVQLGWRRYSSVETLRPWLGWVYQGDTVPDRFSHVKCHHLGDKNDGRENPKRDFRMCRRRWSTCDNRRVRSLGLAERAAPPSRLETGVLPALNRINPGVQQTQPSLPGVPIPPPEVWGRRSARGPTAAGVPASGAGHNSPGRV